MWEIEAKVLATTTQLTLTQDSSKVTVSISRISPTNINDARQSLLLDFNVKGDSAVNHSSLEYSLRQTFNDVVAIDRYIGCILKTTVFIVESGPNAESAIFNACWLGFLRHGVPMVRSIYHVTWQPEMTDKKSKMKAIIDLNSGQILSGKYKGQIPNNINEQTKFYKEKVRKFIQSYFYQ